MIIVQVSILVTGNPELFPYPRLWFMSVFVIQLSYPRTSNYPPPLYLSEPLHLKGTVLESNPSGLSQVAALPRPHLKWKTRCTGLTISVDHRLQAPQYFSAPKIIAFLITYQTCHCYHGDNNADHNYYSYQQAGPVPRTMKVNMIMVMTYCFIPILYYGFVHGYRSWMAKQTSRSNHPSLYIPLLSLEPSSSSGLHCFTQCLMTCHTCCLMIWIPLDLYN